MKITFTNIPDVVFEDIDQSKLNLGEKVYKNISPLLDEHHLDKLDKNKNLKIDFNELKNNIKNRKDQLQILIDNLKKKEKTKELLEKIRKIISAGLIYYDMSFREEIVVLLNVIDELPEDKINFYCKEMTKNISQRFTS